MKDYSTAFQHILNCCPDLRTYLNNYAVPNPGDWPTWFYQKKIIAQQTPEHILISLMPEQGPLHVSLNSQEDVMSIYNFFFCPSVQRHFWFCSSPSTQAIPCTDAFNGCALRLDHDKGESVEKILHVQRP